MSLVQFPPNDNSSASALPRWLLYRSACYLGNRGLTFGDAIVPHASKSQHKTSLNVDVMMSPHVDILDNDLRIIADNSLDHIFVGPRLEMMDNPPAMLKTLTNKLAVGGHLSIAQKINNTKAKFYWQAAGVAEMVKDCGRWQQKASYERDGMCLQIYKKQYGKRGIDPQKPKPTKPTVCIARYGALGDAIIMTPLIKRLHEDGYHVTLNISPYASPIFANNPHIDNIVLQERDMIPNPELGAYWAEWEKDYDKYLNLSESLEGRFLKVEGRRDFFTPLAWRQQTNSENYYEATMRLGGYPGEKGVRGELFFTNAEERNAQKFFSQYKGKFIVLWALNGSSHHKVYPFAQNVLHEWLTLHDDTVVVTVGDGHAKTFEYPHMRHISMVGKWSIRESLLAAKLAGCVVGPETMMTNAGGSMGTPTITMLSHSGHRNICSNFPNDYCLSPDHKLAPCYNETAEGPGGCGQLHYSSHGSCPMKRAEDTTTGQVVAEAPACTFAITPERVLTRLEEVYRTHFKGNN